MSASHHALIIEDDDLVAQRLGDLVASLGHGWRRARTLEELRGALAPGEGPYCYALLDMQFPLREGTDPDVASGEMALELLRQWDSARNPAGGKHWFQILVATAFWREPEIISRMLELEADRFIPKPLGEKGTQVLSEVRGGLRQAGRLDHGQCGKGPQAAANEGDAASVAGANGAPPVVPAESVPVVARVVFDALRRKRQMGFLVDGHRRWLMDSKYVPFFRMGVARTEEGEGWRSRTVLKMAHVPELPSRVGEKFRGLVPAGFKVVEADGEGNVRLNPGIEVAAFDWVGLEGHPCRELREIAKGVRGKGGK